MHTITAKEFAQYEKHVGGKLSDYQKHHAQNFIDTGAVASLEAILDWVTTLEAEVSEADTKGYYNIEFEDLDGQRIFPDFEDVKLNISNHSSVEKKIKGFAKKFDGFWTVETAAFCNEYGGEEYDFF